MKIGKYDIFEINACSFKLDGGAMFGVVPKALWSKEIHPDENNRVILNCRLLLLKSENKNILIDAGLCRNYDEKFAKIYEPKFNYEVSFDELLERYNLSCDQITDVILTHLHFDHCGGCLNITNGKAEPTFKFAKHHVQKTNFDWALNPSEKDKGSFHKDKFFPLIANNLFVFHYGDFSFDDNIKVFCLNGHTFGMQSILIEDENIKLFYSSDLISMKSNIYLPYISAFDIQPLETLKEKKYFLDRAANENWHLVFNHDPDISAATVTKNEKGYVQKEAYKKLEF